MGWCDQLEENKDGREGRHARKSSDCNAGL